MSIAKSNLSSSKLHSTRPDSSVSHKKKGPSESSTKSLSQYFKKENTNCDVADLDLTFSSILQQIPFTWKKISAENLVLEYCLLLQSDIALKLFSVLENSLEYFTGDLARIRVFGKWHNIPRKQVTYGDPGLTYTYSGITTPALPWPEPVKAVRELLKNVTGIYYNFVLVNRYNDGKDRIGEHRDDEKDLDCDVPIASVSLGQPRTFYFIHQDARNKKRCIPKVELLLESGSVLLMRPPTNRYWYHALPPRATARQPRINLTFRSILPLQ